MTLGRTSKFWISAGALCAALSVGLGAFGAHGLKDVIGKSFTPKKTASTDTDSDVEAGTVEIELEPETRSQFIQRRLENWETASRYQMYHALGMILVALSCVVHNSKLCRIAAILFSIGIVLFSGSLYALVLTNVKVLGAIVPLGGLSFIAGWICFALAVRKTPLHSCTQPNMGDAGRG